MTVQEVYVVYSIHEDVSLEADDPKRHYVHIRSVFRSEGNGRCVANCPTTES